MKQLQQYNTNYTLKDALSKVYESGSINQLLIIYFFKEWPYNVKSNIMNEGVNIFKYTVNLSNIALLKAD